MRSAATGSRRRPILSGVVVVGSVSCRSPVATATAATSAISCRPRLVLTQFSLVVVFIVDDDALRVVVKELILEVGTPIVLLELMSTC